MSLSDIFNNLKTSVMGTKTADIDRSIDKSLSMISKYSSSTSRNNYIELLKNIFAKTDVNDPASFLKDVRESQVEFFDRSGRTQRYAEYDTITKTIAHCMRALNVLTDVIISPDDITKKSIMVSLDEAYESVYKKEDVDKIKKDLENIKRAIDFERYVDKVVKTTLKKGDYFIEIIHSPKGENAFTILSESGQNTTVYTEKDEKGDHTIVAEDVTITGKIGYRKWSDTADRFIDVGEKQERKIIIEALPVSGNPKYTGKPFGGTLKGMSIDRPINIKTAHQLPPSISNRDEDKDRIIADVSKDDMVDDEFFEPNSHKDGDKEELELKDIFITLHNPKYIIRLETERFRSCLGYLVFPKVDPSKMSSGSLSMINTDIDAICLNIIKQVKDKINSNDSMIINNKDLRQAVANYLGSIESQEDIKVRYVAPDKMSHFRINVDIYDPYGESIFDCVVFDSKLFLALKTANTIRRLTSATDKRVISVETGLPHNAKNFVEAIKENMKKRKISVDKFGTLDTIPSLIASFEDIYIPQRDGKKFIEIDTLRWGGDPQEDIEPLKFIRDNIVANLNLPPAFIGLEENATNRSLLTVESIVFARTIVAYQKQFSECMHDLFEKIYMMIHPNSDGVDILKHIQVAFSPPKASLYEHTMEYLENATRAITTLRDFGIPEEYLKQQYLSFLDWDKIEKFEIEQKLKDNLKSGPGSQPAGAAGMGIGGMGMGMPPMGGPMPPGGGEGVY